MAGKQQRTARKPATKFAHLQKKLARQKTGQNSGTLKPIIGKPQDEKR